MSNTEKQMVPLADVNEAIDRAAKQIQDENMLGATREMVAEGTTSRIKSEVNSLDECNSARGA